MKTHILLSCLAMLALSSCQDPRAAALTNATVTALEQRGDIKKADADAIRLGTGILLSPTTSTK